ncbi:hypothetical protein SAMN05878443_0272 [Carnobacterium alterfunditum]|uniref:Uncharacterized protein n=1 Tax=Carnobacterium alterfunditum TaxID=28230 RepID=A0A1N6EY49_9LACT|nr:hypothetical protein SAMN05878443_0272 [Carnobacterium alterfunditum]
MELVVHLKVVILEEWATCIKNSELVRVIGLLVQKF